MEKLDCCVQGQGHSRISNYQWMFVQMLSSETLNLLLLNLVWWCNIMSQIVFEKDWFAVFKIMVIVMDNVIKICPLIYYLNCWPFLQLNLVWWHIIIRWIVWWKDWSTLVVKVTEKVKNSSECSSGLYFLSCWPPVTKLDMVMQHHGPKCHARRLVCSETALLRIVNDLITALDDTHIFLFS